MPAVPRPGRTTTGPRGAPAPAPVGAARGTRRPGPRSGERRTSPARPPSLPPRPRAPRRAGAGASAVPPASHPPARRAVPCLAVPRACSSPASLPAVLKSSSSSTLLPPPLRAAGCASGSLPQPACRPAPKPPLRALPPRPLALPHGFLLLATLINIVFVIVIVMSSSSSWLSESFSDWAPTASLRLQPPAPQGVPRPTPERTERSACPVLTAALVSLDPLSLALFDSWMLHAPLSSSSSSSRENEMGYGDGRVTPRPRAAGSAPPP